MEAKSILLVDDDSNDIELTLAVFDEMNLANRVEVARDGAEALDYLYRRNQYAGRPRGNPVVMFLDLKMPKVDGHEVLRTVKTDPSLRSLPVVVFSSSRERRDLESSYEQLANAYVVKPVAYSQFMDVIRQLGLFWVLTNEPPPQSKPTD